MVSLARKPLGGTRKPLGRTTATCSLRATAANRSRSSSSPSNWRGDALLMNAATKPMKLDAAQQKRLLRLYQQGEPVSELTCMFGISRSTLFRTLKVLKK